MIRGWWPVLHRQKTEENTDRKHTQETHTGNTDRKHRQKTHRENTDRKHRKKTQRENTERKRTEKTQTENREKTQRENTQTEKTQTEKTHREKTHRENTERKHREKTETQRKHIQKYYAILQSTTQYYSILQSTTCYDSVLQSTTLHSAPEPGIEPRTSCFQGQRPIREANFLGRPYSKACDSKYNARSYRADTKHKRSHAQDNARSNSKSSKFAFRHSFARSTHRILREGSSGKIKMCLSLQRHAIQNFKMYVSLQRRAQKCMKRAHGVGSRPRHTKIIVLPQYRTSDQHEVTKGFARRAQKFAFHHSFGRPTSTK